MTDNHMLDIVVSGAGATGWSFLLALNNHLSTETLFNSAKPLSIGLVDNFDPDKAIPHPGFDARALALSQQSLQFFQKMALKESIMQICTAIKNIHVSDCGSAGQVLLDHADYNLSELGVVVEAQALGKFLLQQGERRLKSADSNMTLQRFQPNQIIDIKSERECLTITLDSGSVLQTRLLVLAEGSHSASRELLRLPCREDDYGQHAIIANMQTALPHKNLAWERFTDNGPLALLPMTQQRSGVVWSVNSAEIESIMALNDGDFADALQHMFGYRLGEITKTGKRQSYPLKLTQVNDSLAHRVVCIGNAAQTLHPIAGQGFNLAFRDAWQLAEHIQVRLSKQDDHGAYQALSAFKQLRNIDRQQTIWFTDGLVRLFSNKNPLLQGVRNLGLFAMQNNSSLKQQFARMAMGYRAS